MGDAAGRFVEELRIGGIGGPVTLTRIGDVLPLHDGSVWVVQPEDSHIAVFDSSGAQIGRVGRAGRGPGEFSFPGGLGWWRGGKDTIWVSDWIALRINLYTPDGSFARSFQAPPVSYGDEHVVQVPGGFLKDGSGIALAEYRPGAEAHTTFPIVRYDPVLGEVLNEIARVDRTSRVLIKLPSGGVIGEHPISDAPILDFGPDRVLKVDRTVPLRGEDGALIISTIDPDGSVPWTHKYPYEPSPLPADEAGSLISLRIPGFQRFVALGTISPSEAADIYREQVRAPRYRPAVRSAHIADNRQLWVQWAGPPGASVHWWELSPEGEFEAAYSASHRLDVRAITAEHLWAVEMDDLDVPSLVRYRIEPHAGTGS